MGGGRSGTTITDIVLGNAEGAESLGELFRFPELRGKPHGFKKDTDCAIFWKKINNEFLDGVPYSLERLEKVAHSIEYHSKFFKTYYGLNSSENIKVYKNYVNNFFDCTFNNVTSNLLIDSSMYPGRAIALSKFLEYPISFIYMRRDPSSVVASYQKKNVEQPSKSPFWATSYYFLINLICKVASNYLKRNGFKVIDIRYEDLILEPFSTLFRIESNLEIDLKRVKKIIENDGHLKVGNLLEGNRIRLKDKIKLRRTLNTSGTKYLLNKLNYIFY